MTDPTRWAARDNPVPEASGTGAKQRKGVYTSGIISKSGEHWVARFLTGMSHAGENLAEVLHRRRAELGRPIPPLTHALSGIYGQMCDASPANTSEDLDTIIAHCLPAYLASILKTHPSRKTQ